MYCPIEVVLLQGIVYLHSRQIVHADIKPHNILLDEHGQPRISDWGISRVSHGFTRTGDPVSGEGAFTQGYAAPEVVGGSKATFASDMYAAPRARLGTPTSCVLLTHQWRMVQVLVWPCSGARCSQSPQDLRIRRAAKCARAAGTSTLRYCLGGRRLKRFTLQRAGCARVSAFKSQGEVCHDAAVRLGGCVDVNHICSYQTFGCHPAGDAILRCCGRIWRGVGTPPSCTVARQR